MASGQPSSSDGNQPTGAHAANRRSTLRRWLAKFPLPQMLTSRLYVRIWLAVVLALGVLAAVVGWMWQVEDERRRAERPVREIIIYNAAGEVLGQAPARAVRPPVGGNIEFEVPLRDGQILFVQLPKSRRQTPDTGGAPPNMQGEGGVMSGPPPRPPHEGHRDGFRNLPGASAPPFWRPSMPGFLGMLALVSVVLAVATYPVVRRLTKRLERVQQGVQRWGEGDLSVRLPVEGHDEVAFLARRFNASAERVQGLLRSHKTLLANASHELRSPLARIRMGLELMDSADSATQAAQRAEVARNIAELDQLVDEILLASRLDLTEAPSQNPEPLDLTALAAEECARVQATLVVQAQPQVLGEERLLRRLIRNLLENACRYGRTDAGAPVEDDVQLTLAQDMVAGRVCAVITVDDRGPGVPERECERIFEPFYRVAGASERQGGVGLGLALVRQIAKHHGGSVQCLRSPEGGARFLVRLPLT